MALCPRCRTEVARIETLGGALLEDLAEAEMADDALATVLSRIKAPSPRVAATRERGPAFFPRPLRDYVTGDLDGLPWKRLGNGIEQIIFLQNRNIRARLLRIAAGVAVPEHGHAGTELTMALQGGFRDLGNSYGRGDVATADCETVHSPAADRGETCICLAVTDAPLKLTGLIGRLLNPFLDL
jgi:putative transcriptional regulator